MGEFNQHPSSFPLQQLLGDLEHFIAIESQFSGKAWVSSVKLIELFDKKHGLSLEEVLKAQSCSDSLRRLLKGDSRFSIYGTPNPDEFYVALLQTVVPVSQPAWKLPKRLVRYSRSR